ncbi:PHD finger domain-containing protein [Terrisporobacter mayombei]|uniref:Phorbol-ester/DAG-type domain-containing protein n=1 Tax=Terrisporobacter mayombei TaxID=1541 RepID=A0ABY9Q188_9FIRM|nr:PHD finger domain-containing protein [Terrisporobacter mayombei]MCC3868644.1 hypothetical protein [Terrisporobacter mayombei]WMT80800.1 hypothetical protein TEMA_11220 [Terrisporobacter mayombei]
MEETDKNICVFCGKEVDKENKFSCKSCNTIYHKKCLLDNNGVCKICNHDNINDLQLEEQRPSQEEKNQETDINEKLTKVEEIELKENKFCTNCGHLLQDGQCYCSKCGMKTDEDKPRKNLVSSKFNKKHLIIILCIVGISIIGISAYNYNKKQEQQQARIEYIKLLKEYQHEIVSAGANLEDISDTVQKYWYENIYKDKHGSSIDSAILMAILDKKDEIELAKTYDEKIQSLYSKLKSIPEGSEDLSDVLSIISDTYNSYTNFYDFAIEPSGNYNEYSDKNSSKTDDFLDKYRVLENYIETDKEFSDTNTKEAS